MFCLDVKKRKKEEEQKKRRVELVICKVVYSMGRLAPSGSWPLVLAVVVLAPSGLALAASACVLS